jgi:predicted nucleic acid-binding protein
MSGPTVRTHMAPASLASYDGTAGVLVDTNVWVDCMDDASPWHEWAVDQLQACSERSPLHINIIVYTELLMPAPDLNALDAMLDVFDTQRSQLPWPSAPLTAAVYAEYKRRGGSKQKPLPDFYIGAHAAVANLSVLTRDPSPYRSYFAKLAVLAP